MDSPLMKDAGKAVTITGVISGPGRPTDPACRRMVAINRLPGCRAHAGATAGMARFLCTPSARLAAAGAYSVAEGLGVR